MPGWQGSALELGRVASDNPVIAQCPLSRTIRQVSNTYCCPGGAKKLASTLNPVSN
jgi:hypothetical protein